ncbi:MAG: HNH endonuclease signature motif containing protein [Patescibacteria group bacterium]|nr:HNH endonuclease signature motif containing protein [Patescibacteria group bacterium]
MSERRVYADRSKYLINAVAKRRRKIREMAIAYKGGRCSICGYQRCIEALDFHHEGIKDFGISANGITRSWEKTRAEIDKCVLLCANCHREIHSKSQPQKETFE